MHAVEEVVQPPYLLGNPVDYRIILSPGKEMRMRVRRHNFGSWAQRYDRLGPLLDEKGLKKGKVLEATVDLVDCEQMWEQALAALKRDPFFFVEKR
jgi:aminoglycoside 3-N-acetyltransferase